jgi:hypothetical protein
VLVGALVLLAGLPLFRYQMLGKLGGYGAVPSLDVLWANFTRGIDRVLRIVPAKRPWQQMASIFSTTVIIAGLALAAIRRNRTAYLLLAGLMVVLFFGAPFALVTKVEQYHLLALGAVIVLTGGIELLIESGPRVARLAVGAVVAAASLSLLAVTRNIAADFAPCSANIQIVDALAVEWSVVPPEIRDWLRAKPAACANGSVTPLASALPAATWSSGGAPDDHGRPVQWTSETATILFRRNTARVVLAIRRPDASPAHPVIVIIHGPVASETLMLTTSDWQERTISVPDGWRDWLRGMDRVDIEASPIFVPAALDSASHDFRHLGVQFRVVSASGNNVALASRTPWPRIAVTSSRIRP